MKAKKKPLDTVKPADLGVDVAPRLKTLKVEPSRPSVAALASKVADVATPSVRGLVSQTQERSRR
jgi:electron transfer flavoprotein beta subunit